MPQSTLAEMQYTQSYTRQKVFSGTVFVCLLVDAVMRTLLAIHHCKVGLLVLQADHSVTTATFPCQTGDYNTDQRVFQMNPKITKACPAHTKGKKINDTFMALWRWSSHQDSMRSVRPQSPVLFTDMTGTELHTFLL